MSHNEESIRVSDGVGQPHTGAGSPGASSSPLKTGEGSRPLFSPLHSARRGDSGGNESSPTATAMPKANFLQKRSLAYMCYAGFLAAAVCRLAFWDLGCVGREHYAELKPNLKDPWWPFKWLGSMGVDVADLQWYYFILALPPVVPILGLFLILSARLKKRSMPVVMPFSPTSGAAATAAVVLNGAQSSSSQGEAPRDFTRRRSAGGVAESAAFAGSPLDVGRLYSNGGGTSSSSPKDRDDETVVGVTFERLGGGDDSLGPDATHNHMYFGKNLTAVYITHLIFGVVIAALITGPGFLFATALMLLNYFGVAQLYGRMSFRLSTAVMWGLHIAILFINFHADGYRFAWFGLSFLDTIYFPLIRWNVHYNMTLLRMIAYNNDFWEARMYGEERREKALSKHLRCCAQCAILRDTNRHISPTGPQAESLRCYKCRTEYCRPLEEYNLLSYLAFLFYPPLFVAGPMASFNAYVSHLHYPTRAVTGKALWQYGLRFLFNAIGLATMMHYVWITAILYTKPTDLEKGQSQTGRPWGAGVDPTTTTTTTTTTTAALGSAKVQLSVFQQLDYTLKVRVLFLFLGFMWFKFNVFWKFFRFFALLDGVDPPEDMRRCFSNTVSIQGFWRDWHASFNLWIVRYMYIPMGGRQRIALSIFPIFFFIAIWHDIELRLLFWALFMCVFMVPEVIVTTAFASKKNPLVLKLKRNVGLYRFLRVAAVAFNMILLIVVNLIGFSIGMSGAGSEISDLISNVSLTFVVLAIMIFFSAANIALQDRDQEAYNNQVLKLKYNLQSR